MDLPFGPWAPDQTETAAPMMVADGVLPLDSGYGPFPSLFTPSTATALASAPRGVLSIVLNSGAWEALGFTASAFYMLGSDYTWGVAVASGYACPTGFDWSALHFGTKLLYTNTFDGLHSYDVEAGGAASYISAAGDPAWVLTCANFVVALNCKDSLGNRNNRLIKTSGFNDQTNWTSDGADYQELADGESLLCGFDLKQNTALLIQQRALVLMQFGNAAGGAQFSLSKVSDGRGAVGARSCISFDGMVFGLATDGFFRFDLGSGLQFIGDGQIDTTFLKSVDQTQFNLVQGAIDPLNKVVMWRYKRTIDNSTTVSEVCIGYSWLKKRWFTVTEQTSYLTRLATVAVTYDAATGTYDSQTLTYDDLSLSGAAPLFGALDENYKFSLWTGPSLLATLTPSVANSEIWVKILRVTPITDAAAPTVSVSVKDNLSDTAVSSGAQARTDSGIVPFDSIGGMNMQFTLSIPAGDLGTGAGWKYVRGLDHLMLGNGGATK